LRNRLNAAEEIEIPVAKLELRPSFPIDLLADSATWSIVDGTLRWFVATARGHPAYAVEPAVAGAAETADVR
jgi:hypothetical protein